MEPITTSAMIGGIVSFLGGKLTKDKSIKSFLSDFTNQTVNWIKPIFLKPDGTEKEIIQKLKEKPESEARKKAIESAIEMELEDHPEADVFIKEIFDKISTTEEGKQIINNIINSKNVNTGNINSGGGSIRIGDNA